MKRSQRSKVVMPSELINVEHPFYNSPSVQAGMLFDTVRTRAFEKAIRKISKGKDVLEIGTGTGILSLFAAASGASSVTATESADETFQAAKKTIKNNNLENKISVIQYKDKPLEFNKKFDVIMSECLGHFAFDENMVSVVAEYKKHLKKDGVFLPRKISLFMALVDNNAFYKRSIDSWQRKAYGFDFSAMKKIASERVYIQTFKTKQITSTIGRVIDYDLKEVTPYLLKGSQKITVTKTCIVHGLAGWFSAELANGVEINTSPFLDSTHWEQCFLPFNKPLKVKKGNMLRVKLSIESNNKSNKVKFAWELSRGRDILSTDEAIV